MNWVSPSNILSFNLAQKKLLDESNKNLLQFKDFGFKFGMQGPGHPVVAAAKYLAETPPSKYGGDEALSPFLLILGAGLEEIGLKNSLEVAREIANNRTQVLAALRGETPPQSLQGGTLIVSEGCLEFKKSSASVMIKTQFSRKTKSCG